MSFNPSASNLSQEQILQQVFNASDNTLAVDATVTATISNVEIKDPNSGNSLSINSDGSLNANTIINATSDSIKSWTQDGTGNPIGSTTGALNVNIKGGGNASVGLDGIIAPLSSTQMGGIDENGNLQALTLDPSGRLLVDLTGSSTVTGTVSSNLLGLNSFQTSQYTIGSSAVQLTVSPLTNRSSMVVKVKTTTATDIVYVGATSSVTTSNGYALFSGDTLALDLTGTHQIWAIGSNTGQIVYILEIGG